MKRLLMSIAIGAMAVSGCVSIQTLEQDLKSNDPQKQNAAVQNLKQVITQGKVPFSTFSTADRLWCANNLKGKKDILATIETMSHRRWVPYNTSEEERDILSGMCSNVNAPILKALLANLGPDKEAFDILTGGNIEYDDQVYDVAIEYVKQYVDGISDIQALNVLVKKFVNWRDKGCDKVQMTLYEHILPERYIALISSIKDLKVFFDAYRVHAIENIDKKILKAAIAKIADQNELEALLSYETSDDLDNRCLHSCLIEMCPVIMNHITDTNILTRVALKGEIGADEAVNKIMDESALVSITLQTRSGKVSSKAMKKIGNTKAIVDGLIKLLKDKKISEERAGNIAATMKDGETTIALFNIVQGKEIKQIVFEKLSETDRKIVLGENAAKCKQMIELAKAKGGKTFEMGGFYLGMDISDVDVLIRYYFPDWTTEEGYYDDDKTIRAVWIPQQSRAFCLANKDGKVWQFNFGKSILRKFCKYDVQNEKEWVRTYSKEHGIDMKYVFINKDTSVVEMSGNFDTTTYKAWLNQDSWQWKNNAKGYRLVYFGEPKIETAHGNMVKRAAAYQFRFVSADAGTLRVTIEND